MCGRTIKMVINSYSENRTLHLYAHIKLAESYWHQIKYESAKKELNMLYSSVFNSEISIKNVDLYSKFAIVFATYCRKYYLIAGQEFLEKIIAFLENNKKVNYNLLKCYNAYSICCVNHKAKQDLMEKMGNIIEKYFKHDQYAKYLYLCAQSWKTQYAREELLNNLKQQVRQYARFMDSYELMINNCDIAVSMYSYYDKQNLFWEYQDTALEYFGDAFDICILIYEDTDYTILNNPYIVILQDKLVLAFSFISVRKLSELVDPILDYAKNLNV